VIGKVRSIFKYANDAALIDKPVRFGPEFKRPGKDVMRRDRASKPKKEFAAAEVRALIDAASQPLRAMILLAINCALGNADCGKLKFRNVDMLNGWLNYPRPKTGIERRCKLWRETIDAIQAAIDERLEDRDDATRDFVFLTKYKQPWDLDHESSPISHEFRKLLDRSKLYRRGIAFYALRHTFRTVADATRDFPAIDRVMGHADHSMGDRYRERIDDERLVAVSAYVHEWLFAKPRTAKVGGGNAQD
jgi:integrase